MPHAKRHYTKVPHEAAEAVFGLETGIKHGQTVRHAIETDLAARSAGTKGMERQTRKS